MRQFTRLAAPRSMFAAALRPSRGMASAGEITVDLGNAFETHRK